MESTDLLKGFGFIRHRRFVKMEQASTHSIGAQSGRTE